MNKLCLCVLLFLATFVCGTAAYASSVHYFDAIGESYGRTSEEAIDNARGSADEKCYTSWGLSMQEYTLLAQWIDQESGYPRARVSVRCRVED